MRSTDNGHGPSMPPMTQAPTRPVRYPLFDVIRIAAALMVVFSHAFTTTGRHEPQPIRFGHSLGVTWGYICLLYTSPSPRDRTRSRMPSSA